MKKKFAIAVHGGAGPDSDHIKKNRKGYEEGLKEAVEAGYRVLEEGGSALDAVETAVNTLEDNPLFNAGRGSALNQKAEVEMCASIMDGKNRDSGAVAIVRNVKNPITLARAVMEKTDHIFIGSYGALDFARQIGMKLEPDAYFITDYQWEMYEEKRKEEKGDDQKVAKEQVAERMHGTVGAVALDADGNLAAATSTGGTEYQKEGRIGDSAMIGIGTFANNDTCAVSTTGDGESLIRFVSAAEISSLMEYRGLSVSDACKFLIHEKAAEEEGDMGLIAIDGKGNISMEFNSDRMHRACKTSAGAFYVAIYKD